MEMPGLRHLLSCPGSPTIFLEGPLAMSENLFSSREPLCHPDAHVTIPSERCKYIGLIP
jgi:hypothetical protein